MGAKHGIMFKTAVSLEETGKIQIVALDKTGTITSGEPRVTDVLAEEGVTEEELLSFAYALEKKSEHPLARAILTEAEEKNIQAARADGKVLQERRDYGMIERSIDGPKITHITYELDRYRVKGDGAIELTRRTAGFPQTRRCHQRYALWE